MAAPSQPIDQKKFKEYLKKYLEIKEELFKFYDKFSAPTQNFLFGQDHDKATAITQCKQEIQFVFTEDMIRQFYEQVSQGKANGIIITMGAWADDEESPVTGNVCPNRPTIMSGLCKITTNNSGQYDKIKKIALDGTDINDMDDQLVAYEHPLSDPGSTPSASLDDITKKLLKNETNGNELNGELPTIFLAKKGIANKLAQLNLDLTDLKKVNELLKDK